MGKIVGLVFPDVDDNIGNDIILEDMTVPQLKDFAELNGIDIGTAYKKADIINAIIKAGDMEV